MLSFLGLAASTALLTPAPMPTIQKSAQVSEEISKDLLVKPEINDASLFKNGFALITRSAVVPSSGTLFVADPPSASLGTLFIYGSDGAQISSVIMTKARYRPGKTTQNANSLSEVLSWNVGKVVTLSLRVGSKEQTVTGKLVSHSDRMIGLQMEGQPGAEFFTADSVLSVKIGPDGVWSRENDPIVEAPAFRITAKPGSTIYLSALQRGSFWNPSYVVNLIDDKKLTLTARATILNDLGDFNKIPLKLVTGFPNLPFLGTPDPLSFQGTADAFLGLLMGGGLGTGGGGFGAPGAPITNQAAYRRESSDDMSGFESFVPTEGDGFAAEDLYFYEQKNVTLKRGDRGYFVLFQSESEYKRIHTLDLPMSTVEGGLGSSGSVPLDVWSEIEFKNDNKMPLTTGTVSTIRSGQVVGQDLLKYTSAGAKTQIKITKALDVVAGVTEEEVGREAGVIKDQNGYPLYDLVEIQGTLEIQNRKAYAVEMKISKQLEGEVTLPAEAKVTKLPKLLNQMNPTSQLSWTPKVESGKSMTITYRYKAYVRVR